MEKKLMNKKVFFLAFGVVVGLIIASSPINYNISTTSTASVTYSQNVFETIYSESGSLTADNNNDSINISGGTDIDTSIIGDKLWVNYTGSGGSGSGSGNIFDQDLNTTDTVTFFSIAGDGGNLTNVTATANMDLSGNDTDDLTEGATNFYCTLSRIQSLLDSNWIDVNNLTVNGESVTDTLIGQWNTAYGWGDHSIAGYLSSQSWFDQDLNTTDHNISFKSLNINASSSNQGINLRPYSSEDSSVSIVFWDDPSSTDLGNRIGKINAHGNNTPVTCNEIAFYMTDSNGDLQNMWKMVGQEDNPAGSLTPLILTGAKGISRTSGNQINIGDGVLGGGDSIVRIHGNLQIHGRDIDNSSGDNYNFKDHIMVLNSNEDNSNTVLRFWNQNDNLFDQIYLDKFGFAGWGNDGFVIENSLYVEGKIQPSNTFRSSDGTDGWDGTFTNGDGATVTVKDGIITDVS